MYRDIKTDPLAKGIANIMQENDSFGPGGTADVANAKRTYARMKDQYMQQMRFAKEYKDEDPKRAERHRSNAQDYKDRMLALVAKHGQKITQSEATEAKKAPVTDKDDDGKGMDPVGHADKDIDNDGDHDSTDKYLIKRRKAITKAVKSESKGNIFQQLKGKVEEPLKGYPYNEEVEEVEEGILDNLKSKLQKARDDIKNFHKTDAAQKVRDQQKKRIEKGKEIASAPNLAKKLNRQSNEEVQIDNVLVQIDEIINSLGHRDAKSDAERERIKREIESDKKRKESISDQIKRLEQNYEGLRRSHDAYVDRYHAADENGDDEAADRAREASDRIYKQMQDLEDKMDNLRKSKKNESVNIPTKANGGIAHDCATHVAHEEYGLGHCVSGEHTLHEDGTVTHYDVIFERVGLKRDVPVNELKITASEKHLHASKKKDKNFCESVGDDLFNSVRGSKDFRDAPKVDKFLRSGPLNGFHSVGKPIVVQVEDDMGDAEDIIYYSDGKYVMIQVGHKEVRDFDNVPNADRTQMHLVDPSGNLNPSKFKAWVSKDSKSLPREYGMKVKKITNSVRDFSKVDDGQDIAPRGIRREPFKN